MEQQITYTQEQLNVACKSYSDEARRLMDIKGALMIESYNMKKQIQELQKQNAELRKQNSEQKVQASVATEAHSSNGLDNKHDKSKIETIL